MIDKKDMKYKHNSMIKKKKNGLICRKTSTGKRAFNIFMATVLVVNSVLFDFPSGVYDFFHVNHVMVAEAAYTQTTDATSDKFDNIHEFTVNDRTVESANDENYMGSLNAFYDFCYYYSQNANDFASKHQSDTININSVTVFSPDFAGIGNADYPFQGKVTASGTSTYAISLPTSLFTYVYDSVSVKAYGKEDDIELQITRSGTDNTPLMAQYVVHDDNIDEGTATAVTWKVQAVSDNANSYGGVIGEMGDNATLSLEFTNHSNAEIKADGDVGVFCGKLHSGSNLRVNYSGSNTAVTVTSANGNAGGIAGSMMADSILTLNYTPSGTKTITASNGYAGGVVGDMVSSANLDLTAIGNDQLTISGEVTGANGAGGLYGRYINFKTETASADQNSGDTIPEFDIAKYNIGGTNADLTVDGLYAGGLIGVLENGTETGTAEALRFTNSGGSGVVNTVEKKGSAYTEGYYGGLIGMYKATDLADTLEFSNMAISSNSQSAIYAFGGVVGLVDSVAYVKVDHITVTAKHSDPRMSSTPSYAFFGGLIGATNKNYSGTDNNSDAVFVDLGDFKLNFNQNNNTTDVNNGYFGGGIIGQFYKGVLRLSGTTDLTDAKTKGNYKDITSEERYSCYGQLVGYNDDTLVYALGDGKNVSATYESGWRFERFNGTDESTVGSTADDLGTWGEVVRISDIEDATNGILAMGTHTVELKAPELTMSTQQGLVKTALNIQLNDGTNYSGVLTFADQENTSSVLLANTNLSISDSLSFAGSGITGFMRDGSATAAIGETDTGDVGIFSGIFNGNDKIITLAVGESYGVYKEGQEGSGQIYRHRLNGLFSVIGGGTDEKPATVANLTVDGSQTIHNAAPNGMSIGGVVARTHGGTTTLTKIIANQVVDYYEGADASNSEGLGKNIGGVIGYVDRTDNTVINVTGTNTLETKFKFSGYHQTWLVHGALIGKIASEKFTLNIAEEASDTVTVKHETIADDVTEGTNADGGGIVGFMIANGTYSNRKVYINHLVYDGSKDLNIADTNGGGLLGYSWRDVDVTINGLTVTKAELSSPSAGNVGALCYSASGKWTVNSVDLTGLTIKDGAGTSLGMLVNKAYVDNNGLYMILKNSGYTLSKTKDGITTKVTFPDDGNGNVVLEKFDEIAAYTANTADDKDAVLKGGNGAGVISIDMNEGDGAETEITTTGTYQNQLFSDNKTKYPNETARYYYNLNKMSTNNVAQAAVLWSVYQYAPNNIKSLFNKTSPFECKDNTDINLSGYSFYPVYSIGDITLSNVNITFDYKDIYDTAENVGDSDGYKRDPGNNGSETEARNQHFLMQSGLFINVSESRKITLKTVKLSGNFLEVGDYKGVLVSGTCNGSIEIEDLVLDGITPKTAGGAAYDDGYLLVNEVVRNNANSGSVSLNVKNVSNTKEYSKIDANGDPTSTSTITKSLFGKVNGPDISVTLTGIKLDARKSSKAVTDETAKAALDKAYGTVNSIFKSSTLFESIKTTPLAQLVYNYEYKEDWGTSTGEGDSDRNVTYGFEVSNSVEYENKEKYYNQDTEHYTNPVDSKASSAYTFSADNWLPYVVPLIGEKTAYDTNKTTDLNGCYSRELAVNVTVSNELTGCGTYNDPYVITNPSDLEHIAAFLRSGKAAGNLESIILPVKQYDGVEKNTTGNRWCNNDHAEYTLDGTNFTSDGAESWTSENVRLYLEGAYYKINEDIELSSSYVGLGGTEAVDTSGKYAFRGVIVGDKQGDDPKFTITNKSSNPLINISNGCVVKDINIVQTADIPITQQRNTYDHAYFGYKTPTQKADDDTGCAYYGGIIGEIMGGDNIIDNSYVSFGESKITLSGTYGTIVPVGGYVGVVVFGGLIFKNMAASKTTLDSTNLKVVYSNEDTKTTKDVNLAAETKTDSETGKTVKNKEAWAAIYVNPLVGRVINGYAVNETTQFSNSEDGTYHDEDASERIGVVLHTLKNGKKHYSIADINKKETSKLEVKMVPTDTDNDGIINIPNSQALFILSLITQSTSGTAQTAEGSYYAYHLDNKKNVVVDYASLSYGIVGSNVYGTSHLASYTNVGVGAGATMENYSDFYQYAAFDTAANTAVPYIIEHYTVKSSVDNISIVESDTFTDVDDANPMTECTDEVSELAGRYFYCYLNNGYLKIENSNGTEKVFTQGDLANTQNKKAYWLIESAGEAGKYYISSINTTTQDGVRKYLIMTPSTSNQSLGNIAFTTDKSSATTFDLVKNNTTPATYTFSYTANATKYVLQYNGGLQGWKDQDGNTVEMKLYEHFVTKSSTYTITGTKGSCPARCVTSTLGYYNIKLTGKSYVLPDSFRGLGSVGYNDDLQLDDKNATGYFNDGANNANWDKDGYNNRYKNRYCMKVNVFNGNDASIDEDIYINKFFTDNYFNVLHLNSSATQDVNKNTNNYGINDARGMHGIGLFDTIIMKNSDSVIRDFTLSGSVNTAIFDDNYKVEDQEVVGCGTVNNNDQKGEYGWLVSGGVVGHSIKGTKVNFARIALNDLSMRGNTAVGGLLAYSRNSTKDAPIVITKCTAKNIDVKMPSTCYDDSSQKRTAAGAFVGKVYQGGVVLYGTDKGEDNTDLSDYSSVYLKGVACCGHWTVVAGGLVGYAGNGCEAYDMHVYPAEGQDSALVGHENLKMAGGIIGLMSPWNEKSAECVAIFKNCTVQNINVMGSTYAGGFYGGTHNNNWVPNYLSIINCKLIGDENNRNYIRAKEYAGGLVGDAYVYQKAAEGSYNFEIADSEVLNYNIYATNNSNENTCSGGFFGYTGSQTGSVVCYVHDSAVVNCTIGYTGNTSNYAGGIIGRIAQLPKNQILGYNIKLDNVTAGASANKMGAWIGYAKDDTTDKVTEIMFAGLAIYGYGFSRNIGNNPNIATMSFVYADYTGKSNGMTTANETKATYNDTTDVESPKYPYVNVNPQSSMGTKTGTDDDPLSDGEKAQKVISSDGAVLLSDYAQSGTKINFDGAKTYAYNKISTSEKDNLDGKVILISCARSDFENDTYKGNEVYLYDSSGSTLISTNARKVIFTKSEDGTSYYITRYDDKNPYLSISTNNNNNSLTWNKTPTKFEVGVDNGSFTLKLAGNQKTTGGNSYVYCNQSETPTWSYNDTDDEGRLFNFIEEGKIPVSEADNLDGRVFLISNKRSKMNTAIQSNWDIYLNGATGSVYSITGGTPILFTKNADGTYYLTSMQSGSLKYLQNKTDNYNPQWNTTPTKFTVAASDDGEHFTIKLTTATSKDGRQYLYHNNGNSWGAWSFDDTNDEGRLLYLTEVTFDGTMPDVDYSYSVENNDGTTSTAYYTSVKTMAAQLYADINLQNIADARYSRRYTSFVDAVIKSETKTVDGVETTTDYYIGDYLKRTIDIDGDRISTYATEKGITPSGWDDFACVVIANTDDAETTALINRYIQLVTNTADTEDYSTDNDFHKIVITQCGLENGYFRQTGKTPGITHTDGTFALNQFAADSVNKNTFTLIDVQFTDPLHTDKVAYHLYVPVYTIKQMTFDFHAAVLTGTDSVTYEEAGVKSNAYAERFGAAKNLHLDTFESWTTTYIRYTYGADDLNALINAGNINWNHKKLLTLALGTDDYDLRLPDGTYMILVDPNVGRDKVYYATVGDFTKTNGDKDITLELERFKRNDSFFEVSTLNELIAESMNENYNPGKGFYNRIKGTPSYNNGKTYVFRESNGTKTYYEYVPTGKGDYDLSLSSTYVLNEDYYISTYAPKTERDSFYVYDYKIEGPATLAAPAVRTKSATRVVNDTYQVIIGELFSQSTDKLTVTPDDQQITASNKVIDVYTTTSLWLTEPQIGIKLGNTGQGVYHGLSINLDNYDEAGNVTNEIQGLDSDEYTTRIHAWYSTTAEISSQSQNTGTAIRNDNIDLQDTYLTVRTTDDIKTVLSSATQASPYVVYTHVQMNFNENNLEYFPQKKGSAGVNVRVASNLAYETDKLATSNMTAKYAKDRHMYYRESIDSASLNYMAVSELDEYDSTGELSENYSRLGVNGRTSKQAVMPINSRATYNAQALGATVTDEAEYLHLRFALNKKTDTVVQTQEEVEGENVTVSKITKVEYVPVKISDYMNGTITFKSGGIEKVVNVSNEKIIAGGNGATYIEVDIPRSEESNVTDADGNQVKETLNWQVDSDIYTVDISFGVKTGDGFTEYANYRIDLQAVLLDTNKNTLDETIASDHLVYTNAKVNHEFLKSN